MEGVALLLRGRFYRPVKQAVSLRLDADVIAWLKKDGQGYQTRANQMLRADAAGFGGALVGCLQMQLSRINNSACRVHRRSVDSPNLLNQSSRDVQMNVLAPALTCLLTVSDYAVAQQTVPTPVRTSEKPQASPTPPQAAAQPPSPNTLIDGTAIKLRLAENITSATAKVGQSVSFEVVEEVDVMGVPVIPKGAQALATVTVAETKKSMGRGGKLDVNIDSVRLADGEKAALRATEGGKGGGHTGAMTAGMVGTAIVFFPAAPLLLFIHGKDITIPKGTEVTAFVSGDMHLEMAKFTPAASSAAPVAASAAQAATASLVVESSVAGADIEVDGAFVGSTPSTVSVASGAHTIVVKKKGFADWSRTMNVSGSGARLNAELEAKP